MSTEISATGLVSIELRQSVLDRLATHSHSVCHFLAREVIFDRGPLDEFPADTQMLRLRHTLQTPDFSQPKETGTGWTLISLGRPEPERLSPEFLIRPIYTGPVLEGEPFERKFEYYRRGLVFTRGPVLTEIYQVHSTPTDPPIEWRDTYLISVTVIIPPANTTGRSIQELREEASERIRGIQGYLKGLVDLGRVEPF
ncbi:uncharacterized protein MELLADRAFT_101127 [Melampsora larici-populina 98AG31]|uniref:Mediator of RNA polymerase II transcription subunit 18 n=1 Tax=Melampsora larici-populina (strain 98AG31 / pathotype 3-4-7) TaxID=747676 RepID=F4R3Q3_MELLP|nr:uncharacterized protein MELLADRAFT_101127 [Melampsora larici-populina 98AG31]EGG13130.1 hypothetical protein MELLADRAFT_101127 [Melampsora larici-populina 98AG31]